MRDSWRHFAAEFIGIFALVFIGGASIMAAAMSHNTNGLIVAALAHGMAVAMQPMNLLYALIAPEKL